MPWFTIHVNLSGNFSAAVGVTMNNETTSSRNIQLVEPRQIKRDIRSSNWHEFGGYNDCLHDALWAPQSIHQFSLWTVAQRTPNRSPCPCQNAETAAPLKGVDGWKEFMFSTVTDSLLYHQIYGRKIAEKEWTITAQFRPVNSPPVVKVLIAMCAWCPRLLRCKIWIWKVCGRAHRTEHYENPSRLIYSGTEKGSSRPHRYWYRSLNYTCDVCLSHPRSNVLKIGRPRVEEDEDGVSHVRCPSQSRQISPMSEHGATWHRTIVSLRQYRHHSTIVIAFPEDYLSGASYINRKIDYFTSIKRLSEPSESWNRKWTKAISADCGNGAVDVTMNKCLRWAWAD